MSILWILSLKFRIQFLIFKTSKDSWVLSIDILSLNLEIHSVVLLSVDIVVSDLKYGHGRDKDQWFDAEDRELIAPPDNLLQCCHIGNSYQKVSESHVCYCVSKKWPCQSIFFISENRLIVSLIPVWRRKQSEKFVVIPESTSAKFTQKRSVIECPVFENRVNPWLHITRSSFNLIWVFQNLFRHNVSDGVAVGNEVKDQSNKCRCRVHPVFKLSSEGDL